LDENRKKNWTEWDNQDIENAPFFHRKPHQTQRGYQLEREFDQFWQQAWDEKEKVKISVPP
jgi:hypothetical protein